MEIFVDGGFPFNVGFIYERDSCASRRGHGAGLESLYTVKGIVGSNPTLSAINADSRTVAQS